MAVAGPFSGTYQPSRLKYALRTIAYGFTPHNKVKIRTKFRLLDGIKKPPAFGGRCEYMRQFGILSGAFGDPHRRCHAGKR